MIFHIQKLNAALCVPFMLITGFRFSKDYRWGTTWWHRLVYRCVWTVHANQLCDRIVGRL
jgi:hypothetical protein